MMSRNDQHLACTIAACKNQMTKISNYIQKCPQQWEIKKYKIQSDIKALKDCVVENIMKFLKEMKIFEKTYLQRIAEGNSTLQPEITLALD